MYQKEKIPKLPSFFHALLDVTLFASSFEKALVNKGERAVAPQKTHSTQKEENQLKRERKFEGLLAHARAQI